MLFLMHLNYAINILSWVIIKYFFRLKMFYNFTVEIFWFFLSRFRFRPIHKHGLKFFCPVRFFRAMNHNVIFSLKKKEVKWYNLINSFLCSKILSFCKPYFEPYKFPQTLNTLSTSSKSILTEIFYTYNVNYMYMYICIVYKGVDNMYWKSE